jgi:phenylalanine-4-hydroxylase
MLREQNGGGAFGTDFDPPAGAAADWTVPQHWHAFTDEQHDTWRRLYARQRAMLRGRVVGDHLECLDRLGLDEASIPDFDRLNERLYAATGWTVVAVPCRVPNHVFHDHLANRRFPAGNFIRPPDQLGYLREPDVFHDVFGHVPLLAIPEWADFVQAIGALGLDACERGTIGRLAQLYWYTVEFGLCREAGALRIYGAGIVSSFDESVHALESEEALRLPFDLRRILRTRYRINHFQQVYFVVDDYRKLPEIILTADLPSLYEELAEQEQIEGGAMLPDEVRIGPNAAVQHSIQG